MTDEKVFTLEEAADYAVERGYFKTRKEAMEMIFRASADGELQIYEKVVLDDGAERIIPVDFSEDMWDLLT